MPEHVRFTAVQTSEALAAGWAHHWNDEQDLDQVQPVPLSAPIKQPNWVRQLQQHQGLHCRHGGYLGPLPPSQLEGHHVTIGAFAHGQASLHHARAARAPSNNSAALWVSVMDHGKACREGVQVTGQAQGCESQRAACGGP
jgi:hypothetical protein